MKRPLGWRRAFIVARLGAILIAVACAGILLVTPRNAAQDPPPPEQYIAPDSEDLNGDFVEEVVIADPASGEVSVESGVGGDTIVTLMGNEESDWFGYAVAFVGDVNGDEEPDMLIGAPKESTGRAYLFYGPFVSPDPVVILAGDADMTFWPLRAGEYDFGEMVGAVTDINADGVPDLRVRTFFLDGQNVETERTYIYSGASGEPLLSVEGMTPFDPWLEVTGDVDGDGDVDQTDLDLIDANLGLAGADLTPFDGDVNRDGVVDAADLALAGDNLGYDHFAIIFDPPPGQGHVVQDPCLHWGETEIGVIDNVWTVCEQQYCVDIPCQASVFFLEQGHYDVFDTGTVMAGGTCLEQGPDLEWTWDGPVEILSQTATEAQFRVIGLGPISVKVNCDWCDGCEQEKTTFSVWRDDDDDNLPNAFEEWIGTNPDEPDTDFNGTLDPDEDADGDGFTNYEEMVAGTDPTDENSFGIGTGGVEPPCHDELIDVLWIDGKEYDPAQQPFYACPGSEIVFHGVRTLDWVVLEGNHLINRVPTGWCPPTPPVVFHRAGHVVFRAFSPDGCIHDIEVIVGEVNVNIDSNNDGVIDENDDVVEEEAPGKLVVINNSDSDGDGIPDYADGFNVISNRSDDDLSENDSFTEIRIEVDPEFLGYDGTIELVYMGSDPGDVVVQSDGTFMLPPGNLRIWTVDADQPRIAVDIAHGGHYVVPEKEYSFGELGLTGAGGQLTLYLEALRPSNGPGDHYVAARICNRADYVRATAFGTQLVAFNETNQLEAIQTPELSLPTPVFTVEELTLANPAPSPDGSLVLADLVVRFSLDDAVSDFIEGPDGIIDTVDVLLNGEGIVLEGEEQPVVLPLAVTKTAQPGSLLKRFDYNGTYEGVIPGVPVQPGVNTVTLVARNAYKLSGYAERAVEVIPTPPPDTLIELDLLFDEQPYTAPTVDAKFHQDGAYLGTVTLENRGGGAFSDPFDEIRVVITDPGFFADPAEVDSVIVTVTYFDLDLDETPFWVKETEPDNLDFSGSHEITEATRPDWSDYVFSAADLTPVGTSQGGTFDPFLIEFLGPAEFAELGLEITLGANTQPYRVQVYEGSLLLQEEARDVPNVFLAVPSLEEQLEQQWGDRRDTTLDFVKGFAVGFWDTGVEIVEGVKAIGKGLWYFVKNYNTISVSYRLATGQGALLAEDQHRLEVGIRTGWAVGQIALGILEDQDEIITAILTGDHEILKDLSDETRLALEISVEIFEAIKDYFGNLDAYDIGRICGRILGEIAVEAALAVTTVGIGNVAKAGVTAAAITNRMSQLAFFTSGPGARVLGRLQAMTQAGGRLTKMATSRMCFVAGTLVATRDGHVPIQDVRTGDLVLSRDPVTGRTGYKPVVRTFVTHPTELYDVTYRALSEDVTDGANASATLTCTGEHPFYVNDQSDFVPARELRIGDWLVNAEGARTAYIEDIEIQRGPPVTEARPHGWDGTTYTTYNFEVADWHTYFVRPEDANETDVWVHNAGRAACERALSWITRTRDRFGLGHWETFVKTLERTNTPKRRGFFDPVMPEVIESLMEAMYKDAVPPNGIVDLSKVKSVAEMNHFRAHHPMGSRIQHIDLHNHHVAPQKWTKELLRRLPQYQNLTDGQMKALLDEMPGFLVNKHYHTNNGAGIANFHDILDSRMVGANVNDPSDILRRIEEAYSEWDEALGPKVWAVARKWLQDKGVE